MKRSTEGAKKMLGQYQTLLEAARQAGIHHFSVGAIIANEAKRVLLVRRALTEQSRPGQMEIPGGGVEADEALDEALRREVLEETGLVTQEPLRYVGYQDFVSSKGRRVRQFVFLVAVRGDNVTLNATEHDTFVWATPGEVEGFGVHAAVVHMMKELAVSSAR